MKAAILLAMRRYAIWLISAVVAIVAFAIGRLAGVPGGVDLVMGFAGAVTGTVLGNYLMLRLHGPEPAPPPRGRGSGRRAR